MRCPILVPLSILSGFLFFSGFAGAPAAPTIPADPHDEVETILRNLLARARAVAGDTNAPACIHRKSSHLDTLDASGAVKRTKTKTYEVTVRRGMTENRLVSVEGRNLSPDESRGQSEKERRWRETYAGGRERSPLEKMDQLVNESLIQRFEFTLRSRERVRNRDCWVLDFQPKPKMAALQSERLIDRVLDLLRGRIWVSMDESEIVRADVRTHGALRLWGGILGSLESFQLHLDREPTDFGVWFNRHAEVTLRARRLFSPVHVRLREIGSDARRGP